MTDRTQVAVIGAGIAGLAAAFRLLELGSAVTVLESAERVGGRIGATTIDGVRVPTAADNFLVRSPQVADLARTLGLGDQLVAPAAGEARIARDGGLAPLPPTLLGIPIDFDALGRSGLISPDGLARAREDLTRPDDRPEQDESVGSLVRRRLGDEVLEYLVDPLLGGINAGDSDRLSVEAGVPQVATARSLDPSIVEGARQLKARSLDPDAPVFQTVRGGIERLVDELAAHIVDHPHGDLRLGADAGPVVAGADGWEVSGNDADRVVVATPTSVAADIVRAAAPRSAALLDRIEYSSVALVLLVIPPGSIPVPRRVSGVLVPRLEGHHITAVSFASHKWPDLTIGGCDVLRVSVGRRTDDRWRNLDDDALVAVVLDDLHTVLGVTLEPRQAVVTRWMHSLPQYDVGHAERIDEIESQLADEAPGICLAGAGLRGLGLPACVQSGFDAAEAVAGVT